MNCRDTERLWNELIDATRPDLEAAIEAHASTCPACARIGSKYRTLRQAIASMDAAPVASPALVARLRGLGVERSAALPFPARRPIHLAAWLSAAAAMVVAVAIGSRTWQGPATRPDAAPTIARATPRSISDAFAEATSATLDLARETSAPAGRVGRIVLDATSLADAESPLTVRVSAVPTAEILKSVSDRVGAGVRPLSGSARQAFGFLIRTTTGDRPAPARPRGT